MYTISIWTKVENANFKLTYKQKGFADEALAALNHALDEWASAATLSAARFHDISDDYGHVLRLDLDDFLMGALADVQLEHEAGQMLGLAQVRAQVDMKAKIDADPKLRILAAMAGPRPAGFQS